MSLIAIDIQTRTALLRLISAQVHFSDVFSETVPGVQDWWKYSDFDASLTVMTESEALQGLTEVPIGERPWLTQYGLVTLDDLVQARQARLVPYLKVDDKQLHRGLSHESHLSQSTAVVVVANEAQRDETSVANGHNGEDFYLAITHSGLEIYTTPLHFLSGLVARNRIAALYRIPTEGHPEFDGQHEQFRSARIIRSRYHPDHLVQVDGEFKEIIPTDNRLGHIAYVDKFGNVRGELRDISQLTRLEVGETVLLVITNKGHKHKIEVIVAEDLRSAPLGKLAVYTNCSDQLDQTTAVGFFELVSRVNGSPSKSRETAIYQILEAVPDLDFASAELSLIK